MGWNVGQGGMLGRVRGQWRGRGNLWEELSCRTPETENDSITIPADHFGRAKLANTAFGCTSYTPIVVDAADSIHVLLILSETWARSTAVPPMRSVVMYAGRIRQFSSYLYIALIAPQDAGSVSSPQPQPAVARAPMS
jgi:hypothetical protein